MKDILTYIKNLLPTEVSGIKDIEIIPDPDMIPERVRFPFVGIKDGDITSDGGLDPITSFEVRLYIYVQIKKPEASIIGSGDAVGVLELSEDVLNGLDTLGNLGLSGIINNYRADTSYASVTGENEAGFIQRKEVRYIYKKNQ